jgi:hypothetical protein
MEIIWNSKLKFNIAILSPVEIERMREILLQSNFCFYYKVFIDMLIDDMSEKGFIDYELSLVIECILDMYYD